MNLFKGKLIRINMMKVPSSVLLCLLITCLGASACYEPIANTSDSGSNQSESVFPEPESTAGESDPDSNKGSNSAKEEELVKEQGPANGGFRANFESNLKRHGIDPGSVLDTSNAVESRILAEYGAVFLTTADPPSKVMFTSEPEVSSFQSNAGSVAERFGGVTIELQPEAMNALKKAASVADSRGLKITPRDGAEAGRRSYAKTLDLWNSRFLKAADHWRSKGRLTADQVSRLKSLPIKEQVSEVLELEKSGIYFNTFFNNSILYSVAAPGTSQHLSMLAFDVSEFQNAEVRNILAEHGWFRTVQNDEPHFTYLGLKESDLPSYGLKKVSKNGGDYWIPDI